MFFDDDDDDDIKIQRNMPFSIRFEEIGHKKATRTGTVQKLKK